MLDAYTNTFRNVSSRSTGGKPGQYAIVGPTWKGKAAEEKIQAPTNTVWLIGRVEVKGKESNWLPSPPGDFNLVLRMFEPKPRMLEKGYKLPPVKRISG
ncbi:DUF1254 domain-containing protein [Brevibacillus massiliensis]|jgi:hypothetical protein|uniref:DUF1254 domain-containing protein n=1 Tax=Brevibacillus massiliensis TaxID=1118054 RepID=UPI0002E61BB6|nr:DUF1254 domain-containing protein [Brevibacillus massiliensis]